MAAERESHRTVATAARNAAQKETVLRMWATALSRTGIWKRHLAFSISEQALAVRRLDQVLGAAGTDVGGTRAYTGLVSASMPRRR